VPTRNTEPASVPDVDAPALPPARVRRSGVARLLDATDADKVLFASGLTFPFAVFWLWRAIAIARDPSLSPHVDRAFLEFHVPFLAWQMAGHGALALAAFVQRRRRRERLRVLVQLEIFHWISCACVSIYSLGGFTSPFVTLAVALPILGTLLFGARRMRAGLALLVVGVAAALLLPQFGLLPYAPFLARAPFDGGVLSSTWALSVGAPSVFVGVLLVFVHHRLLDELRRREAELVRLSTTDALTQLANRAQFFDRLGVEIARAERHGHALSVAMLDADHFKAINDTLGHLTGDDVLVRFARALRASLRTIDLAARYGGEEFAVILPHTGDADARVVAERLRLVAHEVRTEGVVGRPHLTVSIGFGAHRKGEPADAFLARVDAALYRAKKAGRDRAAVAEHVADKEEPAPP